MFSPLLSSRNPVNLHERALFRGPRPRTAGSAAGRRMAGTWGGPADRAPRMTRPTGAGRRPGRIRSGTDPGGRALALLAEGPEAQTDGPGGASRPCGGPGRTPDRKSVV